MIDVGVVIPAYDAERFLREALESVLAQTHRASRIVVVDDGSRDRTAEIAESFGPAVTCVRQPNHGVAAARNRGAAAMGTEWLSFLDADDVWEPGKLARQAEAADAGNDVVLCDVRLVDAESRPLPESLPLFRDDLRALLFHRDGIPQGTSSTLLVRRSLFEAVGGYDERLATMADWDLLLRLRLKLRAPFGAVQEPLVRYRRYAGTMSRSVAMLERETLIVLRKAFSMPDLPPELRALERRCVAWNDGVLAGSHFWAGNWWRAARFASRALLRDPRLAARILGFPLRQGRRLLRAGPHRGL